MESVIHLDAVSKIYHVGVGVTALDNVDLVVPDGQYVAIMGSSGSGKSTMLNLLGCLDRPTAGKYYLGGDDVSTFSDNRLSEIRNTRLGFVFQSFNLISWMTVTQNIEIPLFYKGVSRSQRYRKSAELADMVGLGDRLDHRPSQLSGGQMQRVAIARALSNDPMVLLADEPTGNLDTHTGEEIMELFAELNARGRTILMVTHEPHIAAHADRVITLRDGQVESDVLDYKADEHHG
ncbi:MAG: ABC transporter ATP-binding protein [Phycisphaerae bacterium]|jgi:putative ABC transport system ATP-binding protein|nr:ABC transporter ATP-binding protein [Phycisphaerae bacterium]